MCSCSHWRLSGGQLRWGQTWNSRDRRRCSASRRHSHGWCCNRSGNQWLCVSWNKQPAYQLFLAISSLTPSKLFTGKLFPERTGICDWYLCSEKTRGRGGCWDLLSALIGNHHTGEHLFNSPANLIARRRSGGILSQTQWALPVNALRMLDLFSSLTLTTAMGDEPHHPLFRKRSHWHRRRT